MKHEQFARGVMLTIEVGGMRLILLLTLLVGLCPGPSLGQNTGGTVVVIRDTKIMVREATLGNASAGTVLRVFDVNGPWLWVSSEATGWISKSDVTDPEKALTMFSRKIKDNPQDGGAYVARGMVYRFKGEVDLAISDFSTAIGINPQNSAAYSGRGHCWFDRRRDSLALADFKQAITLDATRAADCNNIGMVVARQIENEAAINEFLDEIHSSPPLVAPEGPAMAGAFADAIGWLNKAIEIKPLYYSAYINRGRVFAKNGDYPKALADYEHGIKLNSRCADGYDGVGWMKATCIDPRLRDGNAAIRTAQKACDLTQSKDAGVIDTLAAAYAEAGRFIDAVEAEKKAEKIASETQKVDFATRQKLYEARKPFRDRYLPSITLPLGVTNTIAIEGRREEQ